MVVPKRETVEAGYARDRGRPRWGLHLVQVLTCGAPACQTDESEGGTRALVDLSGRASFDPST
jgi:hypothetical protein